MKKSLFLIFILGFVLNSNIFANDTYFFTSGGNLHPTTEKDISIRMKEEVINIVCEKNYYKVTVDFDFENTGNETTLSVGFPFFTVEMYSIFQRNSGFITIIIPRANKTIIHRKFI